MSNISEVNEMVSKINIEEMKEDLEIPSLPQDNPSHTNISSGTCEFVDYTYSKNSEKAIEDIPKEKSIKFSFNSGSYIDFDNKKIASSSAKPIEALKEEIFILNSVPQDLSGDI